MEIIREPKFRLSPTKVPTQITVKIKIPLIYTITVVIFRPNKVTPHRLERIRIK